MAKSFSWVFYALIGAVSAWTTYKVGQASIQWEVQGLSRDVQSNRLRLDKLETGQIDLERKIFDKLSSMHGDIRRIEGKLER